MDDSSRVEELADAATMALVLGWIRSALGQSPVEDELIAEVYRRAAHDCPRWLRTAPLHLQLKSLTVITLLKHNRAHPV
ncbi:MAG: hypothetical protein M3313_08455 [Actinomycetota bacterium]|nr:hypothetical protein [Actinomycetota bacterium]